MAIHAQTFHCIGLWFIICIDVFKKQFIRFFFHNFKQTSVKFKVRPPNFLKNFNNTCNNLWKVEYTFSRRWCSYSANTAGSLKLDLVSPVPIRSLIYRRANQSVTSAFAHGSHDQRWGMYSRLHRQNPHLPAMLHRCRRRHRLRQLPLLNQSRSRMKNHPIATLERMKIYTSRVKVG